MSKPRVAIAHAVAATVFCVSLHGCSATLHEASVLMGGTPSDMHWPVGSESAVALTDQQIDVRLAFLTERLDAGRRHATLWEYGWLAADGGGMVASGVLAGFNSGTRQAYNITEAVKGGIGVLWVLIKPMPGYRGADPVRAMPDQSREDKLAQLVLAEQTLHAAAARAASRTSWLVHLGNLGLNLAGGAALLALGDPGRAALSAGVDSVVGEAQIWSQPWDPPKDWEDYQRFVATGRPATTPYSMRWHITPTARGLAFAAQF